MITVSADYWLDMFGQEVKVDVIGKCVRQMTGRIDCQIEKVLLDGRDVLQAIPQVHWEPMRVRLWNKYYSEVSGSIRDHVELEV